MNKSRYASFIREITRS